MSSITNLSVQQLLKAAALKGKIETLEAELRQLLGSTVTSGGAPVKKTFNMSDAGRARISAAAKLRWSKLNALKAKSAAPAAAAAAKPAAAKAAAPAAKPAKSKMSAATRAALSTKLKAFWAAKKAAK